MSAIYKLWKLAGRVLYYAGLPALIVYFYSSRRSRVLVVVDEEILLEKAWMGSGSWILPGGGIKRGEEPRVGAVRELKEECGISASPAQLKEVFEGRVKTEHFITYNVHAYLLELPTKPEVVAQKVEILKLKWVDWRKVYNTIPKHHDASVIIDRWRELK